jgi:predicted nucleic acid-binding protein
LTQPTGRYHVFLDTSAFFALGRTSDADHDRAVATMRRIAGRHLTVCTSNFIRAETHALILNRRNRHEALRFLQQFDSNSIAVLSVSPADEREARRIIEQYADKDFSYTDATSFALIRRLNVDYALSFDRHFLQFGMPAP